MDKKQLNFIFPIVSLTIIFAILALQLFIGEYKKVQSLQRLQEDTHLVNHSANLIHSIQKERGLSAGFISTKGTKLEYKLKLQREKTDYLINKLTSFISPEEIQTHTDIKKVLNLLEDIKNKRVLIDKLQIDSQKVIEYYSTINRYLLSALLHMSNISSSSEVRKKVLSYYQFLNMKEHAGIQRALGMVILKDTNFNAKIKLQFYEQIVQQKLYKENFLQLASPKLISYYNNNFKGRCITVTKRIEKAILNAPKGTIFDIDIVVWYENMTQKINKLNQVAIYINNDIKHTIDKEISQNYVTIILFGILNIIGIILFIYMVRKIIYIIHNERTLKNLIDANIISSTTDLRGVITSVSKAFCDISGYSKEELLNKPHSIIRHPDMPKETFKQMWETIKSGKEWRGNIKNLKKDGGYYWVDARIKPVFDKNGTIKEYFALRQDITSKIDLELEIEKNKLKDQQLLQQSRLAQMGEMISMIAHQWRQPLTSISSTSTALQIKAKLNKLDNRSIVELATKISTYTQHLSSTIDDFRDFFKINKEKKRTTYNEVLHSVLNIIEVSITNKGITIKKEFNSDIVFNTYPNELKQVILNLLKNAEDILLEKKIENPQITIITQDNKLIVKDNAGGVPQDIIDNIFDPYFSTKLEKNGTGLGLYMSKTIIEEHCNGTLSVENDDEGACFTITL